MCILNKIIELSIEQIVDCVRCKPFLNCWKKSFPFYRGTKSYCLMKNGKGTHD